MTRRVDFSSTASTLPTIEFSHYHLLSADLYQPVANFSGLEANFSDLTTTFAIVTSLARKLLFLSCRYLIPALIFPGSEADFTEPAQILQN